jgi:hypothetical protein
MFTEYWLEITGPPEDLASIQDGLSRGLVKMGAGSRDDFVLDPGKVYPGLSDESSRGVVGIDKLDPYAQADGAYVGSTQNHEVFEASADGSRMRFSGEATNFEFLGLAERLSGRHPAVRIDVGGTTDHEIVERWSVAAGSVQLLDHGAYTGEYLERFEWYVKDGIRLGGPLEVHVGDAPPATLSGELFVHELDVASVEEIPRG